MAEEHEMPVAWEKQSHESQRAFEAFRRYLELGPGRSLAKLGRKLGCSKQNVEEWSTHNDWVARSSSYDAWMNQQAINADIRETEERGRQAARERELFVCDSVMMAREIQARLIAVYKREWGDPNQTLTLGDLERAVVVFKELMLLMAPLVGLQTAQVKGAGNVSQTVLVNAAATAMAGAGGPATGTLDPMTAPMEVVSDEILGRMADAFVEQFFGEMERQQRVARPAPMLPEAAEAEASEGDDGKES